MRLLPLALVLLVACSDSTQPPDWSGALRLVEVASGLASPVFVTAPTGDARLFVVEQPGRIRIVQDGQLLPTPFLDIEEKVRSGGERGLLGLAFHPSYPRNGVFFVNYTDRRGDTRIERYRVGADPNRADPASARPVLAVEQPFANHNGGQLLFGPDGMLYVPLGDGGGAGDPQGNGQNLGTLLGKMLRLDVDAAEPYAVPADNPFVDAPGARGEIWAYGLRNPWRVAFDREAGLLYVADVGQNEWEEINVVPAVEPGLNFGWNRMEGTHCFRDGCDRAGLVLPVVEYSHADGCSVTGGPVYRGSAIPLLRGYSLYADYCEGWIRAFRYVDGRVADQRTLDVPDVGTVSSFGEDGEGEVYVVSHSGSVYRLDASEP